jgi:hypothetical protein
VKVIELSALELSVRAMSDEVLVTRIKDFLTVLRERMERNARIDEIEQPPPTDVQARQRYMDTLKTIYTETFEGLYDQIASNGQAVCELTDDPEITERVEKMIVLAKLESEDIAELLKTAETAAHRTNIFTVATVVLTGLNATLRQLPRQRQLDQLTLDLTAYCLTRFPI